MMNLFARALGGIVSDRCNRRWGCAAALCCSASRSAAEGVAMMVFSQMQSLPLAIATMMLMGLFVKMSNGANYAVVPFVNKRALGAVAGIVGAGGNLGAVLAGFSSRLQPDLSAGVSDSGRDHRPLFRSCSFDSLQRNGRNW